MFFSEIASAKPGQTAIKIYRMTVTSGDSNSDRLHLLQSVQSREE